MDDAFGEYALAGRSDKLTVGVESHEVAGLEQ
jgi:hypothetical protein